MAGLGRMGAVHLLHLRELEQETGCCKLVAVAEPDAERARRAMREAGCDVPVFDSVASLADAGICGATVVATPTADHRDHAMELVRAGQRVLLEKPLTGDAASDRELAAELDRKHPNAVMIAARFSFHP